MSRRCVMLQNRHSTALLMVTLALLASHGTGSVLARENVEEKSGRVFSIEPNPNAEFELRSRLIEAQPGDIIELAEGNYRFESEFSLICDHVTIRGAGMDKTVLSFHNQMFGSGGLHASGDALTLEDFAVEDTAGNAIKVHGAKGVVFRRVRVEWTGGPKTENGAYGVYPVECENVLVEHCVAIGASDAGIYVGQCRNVIVRHCRAEFNVAGIEIENTIGADVHDNVATQNTGGLLVFDLPGLNVINGRDVRLHRNKIFENNTPNFAPKGTSVADVPTGTGVMIMATDKVEVFENTIRDHVTANILVISYLTTQRRLKNSQYDPFPEGVTIRDNQIAAGGGRPQGDMATVLLPVLGRTFPDILFDGHLDAKKLKDGRLPETLQLRMQDNGTASFANLHLDKLNPKNLLTGAYRVDRDLKPYAGKHAAVPAITMPDHPAVGDATNPAVAVYTEAPRTLSGWGLFEGPLADHHPAADVEAYDLNTPLFSDYTHKRRFIRVPDGTAMTYRDQEVFQFPNGTVIAKTFSYSAGDHGGGAEERILETRIELKKEDAWYGYSYIWNEEQTDAELALGGGAIEVAVRDESGEMHEHRYHVPSANQCVTCHGNHGRFIPLGPTARNLNRLDPTGGSNQLLAWQKAGKLQGCPAPDELPKLAAAHQSDQDSIDARARAYLEVNCAHCHSPNGSARSAGLDLRVAQTDPTRYGVWKSPVATGRGSGGRRYDIVPGKPDDSILVYRLLARQPAVRMPNLARGLVHHTGVELIRDWIHSMSEAKP